MIAEDRRTVKPRTATTTRTPRVTFDSTRHRNRPDGFGAGLLPPTRWTGQHAYSPFTAEDIDFAAECFRHASEAEVDAEEQAYHELLDQMALESAMLDRYTRGYVM